GTRKFYLSELRSRTDRDWWTNLVDQNYDCYTTWSRVEPGRLITREGPDYPNLGLYSGRRGRGAIYASRPKIEQDGQVAGYIVQVVLLEHCVYDWMPHKDAIWKVKLQANVTRESIESTPPMADAVGTGNVEWTGLV